MFEIRLPNEKFKVFSKKVKNPNYQELKNKYKNEDINFYLIGKFLYAYGKDISILRNERFRELSISFNDEPKLTGKILKDAIIKKLEKLQNYQIDNKKFEIIVYEKLPKIIAEKLEVYRGFRLQVIFLNVENALKFFLIVNRKFKTNLSPKEIKELDEEIYDKFKIEQGELNEDGKINKNLGKMIFEDIKNFVSQIGFIDLPYGLKANINNEPYCLKYEDKIFSSTHFNSWL